MPEVFLLCKRSDERQKRNVGRQRGGSLSPFTQREKEKKPSGTQGKMWLIRPVLNSKFDNLKRLGVLLLSLDGMLVHPWFYPQHFCQVALPIHRYPFILQGGERLCESKVTAAKEV